MQRWRRPRQHERAIGSAEHEFGPECGARATGAVLRLTDQQIVAILREADRVSMPVVAKLLAVSEQTIYTWRKR